jgi:hypothetical protein
MAHGHMPVPSRVPRPRVALRSIHTYSIHPYHHRPKLTCHILRSTRQYPILVCCINTWQLTHILLPRRRRRPKPLLVSELDQRRHNLRGASVSGLTEGMLSKQMDRGAAIPRTSETRLRRLLRKTPNCKPTRPDRVRVRMIAGPRQQIGIHERAMKARQDQPMGMGLFILSCSSHGACQIGIRQKASRGACPARAAGQETRVGSRAYVFSLRMKSRISSGLASLRTRRLIRRA